jgi:glycosyltransferase involved in cell wall biosynthesis
VTIYAGPSSSASASDVQWRSSAYDFKNPTLNNLALIKQALQEPTHDIYHSHLDFLHYFIADETIKPIIYTQHFFPGEATAEAAQYNATHNVLAVPPTTYMLDVSRQLGLATTEVIYHGIDLQQFTPATAPRSNRLLYVGRIAPHKGVSEAVQIARLANAPLDIVGKIETKDQAYWQTILPLVDGEQIRYLGPKPHSEVSALFANAKAFLFPSQTVEAFGQTTIEAQACGTPVIISDIGASNELVLDGKTGFVVKTEAEFVDAIRRVDTIDGSACRAQAERFSLNAMVAAYEALYQRLLGASANEI